MFPLEVLGKLPKPLKIFKNQRFMIFSNNIPIYDTCGRLKIRFKNFDLQFALVLCFYTGITLFAKSGVTL